MKPEPLRSSRDLPTAGGPGQPLAPGSVAVYAIDDTESVRQRTAQLAAQLNLPLFREPGPEYDLLLTVTAERLELRVPERGGPKPLYVDFVGGPLGYARRVNRFGMLFRAVGFRTGRPTVLDATAGLGHDAFLLAYHGCRVTAIERSPVLFAILQDGLGRAAGVPEIREHLENRLSLRQADAREVLRQLTPEEAPDVVYLDPMYPPQKKTALAKVEMRIIRRLVGDDPDAGELFEAAQAIARQRVVVKRHRHAEPLAPEPTHSHCDQSTRYDVYVRQPI